MCAELSDEGIVATACYPHLTHVLTVRAPWESVPVLGELKTEPQLLAATSGTTAADWAGALPSLTQSLPGVLELSSVRMCRDRTEVLRNVPYDAAATRYLLLEVRG